MLKKSIITTFTSVFALNLASVANANDYERGVSVFERYRPAYEALGVKAGAFNVFPEIEITGEHRTNIFKTEDNNIDDFITTIKPAVSVVSDWNLHEVEVYSSGEFALYDDNEQEDFEDFIVGANGRLDFPGETTLKAGIQYSDDHEDRGSADDVDGVEPTDFFTLSANAGIEKKLGIFSFLLEGETKDIDFDDSPTTGAPVNNDDRDRVENSGTLRFGYELPSNYEAYVKGTYSTRDYDDAVDDFGNNRDSDGYDLVTGLTLDITGKIKGDAFVGYQKREYDDASLGDIDGVTFGTGVLWNITGLTSLNLNIARTIEETTLDNASGFVSTGYGAVLEHEILRNLLFGANFNFAKAEYEGGTLNRTDDVIRTGAELRYLVNRNISIKGLYGFEQRETDAADRKSVV